ncbi:MAG: homocysteine S-methyltransferase family protein [Clostridia bacterium]|nr:homocysteine S-methyltransferase family protein [Clostridia bacterium]
MTFCEVFEQSSAILMEGAIIERIKHEYGLKLDPHLDLAGLIYDAKAVGAMTSIFDEYIDIAERYDLPFVMTTPTRRANKERIALSKYDQEVLVENVKLLKAIRKNRRGPIFIGGLMGCKGDAYKATEVLSPEDAMLFHSWQADILSQAGVDFLYAGIMPALSEACGMAKAMEQTGLPYIISFMIREDGRLIDGTSIHEAIVAIDAYTERPPICYMTNCVHPIILQKALSQECNQTETVYRRFKGIQANAACLSPEALDGCTHVETSSPQDLADDMIRLYDHLSPKIFGGCCGTTDKHMNALAIVIQSHLNHK